jgi:undecaprenol kinase/diacylglycerol kinase (ATP)
MNRFLRSFGYAFGGLIHAFKTQFNFKIHCLAALAAVVLGIYTRLALTEWLWIVLAMAIVLVMELLNTAIEMLVDLISPQQQVKAGRIKDVSAAAVLISALAALSIGLLIFVPKFIS